MSSSPPPSPTPPPPSPPKEEEGKEEEMEKMDPPPPKRSKGEVFLSEFKHMFESLRNDDPYFAELTFEEKSIALAYVAKGFFGSN